MKKMLLVILALLISIPAAAEDFQYIYATGAKAMTATLTTTAVVNNGDGTVKLTFGAAHGFLAPSVLYVSGTTNYDGMRTVTAIPSATTISIKAPFVAETPAGTETVSVALKPVDEKWALVSIDIHLSAAASTAEDLTANLDATKGSAWDRNILTKSMAAVADYIRKFDPPETFVKGDKIQFAWTNTDTRTWGINIKWRTAK